MQWVPPSGPVWGTRPMSIGEIIDGSFQVMKRHFATLVRVAAIVVIPTQLLTILINLSAQPASDRLTTNNLDGTNVIDFSDVRVFVGGAVTVAIISFVSQRVAGGAIAHVVAGDYLRSPVDANTSLRYAVKRIVPLVLAGILAFLGILLGTLACIIPGIFLSIAWTVAMPALVVEQIGPVRSLGRSMQLVKPRWWPTLGFTLLLGIMTAIPASLVTIPVGIVFRNDTTSNIIASGIATALMSLVITPFAGAATVLLYFDLRVRHEAFDLQMLAYSLDITPPPAAPSGPVGYQEPVTPGQWGAPMAPPPAPSWGQAPPPPPPPPSWDQPTPPPPPPPPD